MTNYSFLVWLHHKLKRNGEILKTFDDLSKSQWLSSDAIYDYQLDKMRGIISYAKENSEYYKELFATINLYDAREIRSLSDIRRIPVLTKSIMRNNLDRLTAKRRDLISYQTGGSTGVPLHFYCNEKFMKIQKSASGYSAYSRAGYKVGDGLGIIWGYDKDIPILSYGGELIKKYVYGYYELNSFNLTEEKMQSFIKVIRRKKPKFFKGYANSLADISRYILKYNISLGYEVKAIFSEAERLDDETRALIETAFHSKVYNYYGSREFSLIAIECEAHNGLHVNFDQLFSELSENNSVLVTSFLNLGTIFIRYEIGDCADEIKYDKCICGRSSPRLNRIFGRESDNFITADGRVVHGEYVTHLFYSTKDIEQFKIIQNTVTDFDIFVKAKNIIRAEKEVMNIKSQLQQYFKSELSIRVHVVGEIEKTVSGKRKFTICNIKRV